MINTGNGQAEVNSKGITVIDDVNSSNIASITNIVCNCDKYVDYKLPMPTSNNTEFFDEFDAAVKIKKVFENLESDVQKGNTRLFGSITQVNNFKAKVVNWCTTDFRNVLKDINSKKIEIVFNMKALSKAEILFIDILSNLGVGVLIICKDLQSIGSLKEIIKTNIEFKEYGTNENLSVEDAVRSHVKSSSGQYISIEDNKSVISKIENKIGSLDEIERSIYENSETIKVIVAGSGSYIDTCNFYAKMYNKSMSDSKYKLYISSIDNPTYDETSKCPRLRISKIDYILSTMEMFIRIGDSGRFEEAKIALSEEFRQPQYSKLALDILVNKIFYTILKLNIIFKNEDMKYILFYGNVVSNDKLVFDVLSRMPSVSYVIATSDKSKQIGLSNTDVLELENSIEFFPIPTVDTRTNATTMAAKAEQRVSTELFSGDTLGMYKNGQFRKCATKRFVTTYDEIKLWWDNEEYLRPEFEVNGDIATIPVMFNIIKGVYPSQSEWFYFIVYLACGRTKLFSNISGLSGLTRFSSCYQSQGVRFDGPVIRGYIDTNCLYTDRKPVFDGVKLNREKIRNSVNYKYSYLSLNKQDMIFDKNEEIINNQYIKNINCNRNELNDLILNILLNLDKEILQDIQWFEFFTRSPKIILHLSDRSMPPEVGDAILLVFLSLIGFDILVFVPTCYQTIERFINSNFYINTMIIGEAVFGTSTDNVVVKESREDVKTPKKNGFFHKLFDN